MQWEIVSIPSRTWWFMRNLAGEYSSRCLRDVTGQAKYVYSQAITSQMCVNSPRIRVANLTYEETSVIFFLEGPSRYRFLNDNDGMIIVDTWCCMIWRHYLFHTHFLIIFPHNQFNPRRISTQISKLDKHQVWKTYYTSISKA